MPSRAGGKNLLIDANHRIDDGSNDAISSVHTCREALVFEAASSQVEGVVNTHCSEWAKRLQTA